MTNTQGSPPRVRGKAFGFPRLIPGLGITPAHAGKSPCSGWGWASRWDHPRACGEKPAAASSRTHTTGSPPRVRGKAGRLAKALAALWITPACAGKSSHPYYTTLPRGDHPRVCGEKVSEMITPTSKAGSPPRMRGKDRPVFHRQPTAGITPAHAGKSAIREPPAGNGGDHPRACGEKPCSCCNGQVLPGSPPRMRGKVTALMDGMQLVGITPAHAGKRRRG